MTTMNHHNYPTNSISRTNNHSSAANTSNANTYHHQQLHHHHLPSPQYHTLPHHHQHQHVQQGSLGKHPRGPGPDLCSDHDYSGIVEHIDLSVTRVVGNEDPGIPLPPQSYMNPEVTITTIERSNVGVYGTLRNSKLPGTATMESVGTMRKENNI